MVMAYQGYLLEELDVVEGLKKGLDVNPLIGQVVHTVVPLQGLLQGGDKGSQLFKIWGEICFLVGGHSIGPVGDSLPRCNRE